jgi:hypothetical protein
MLAQQHVAINLNDYRLDTRQPDVKYTQELGKTESLLSTIGVDGVNKFSKVIVDLYER